MWPGHRDGEEIVRERHRGRRPRAGRSTSRVPARHVARVQHPLAAERPRPAGVIRDVVAVGEEHEARAAERADAGDERRGVAWRVDEDVPVRPEDEPGGRAEGGLRRVATVEDVGRDRDPGARRDAAGDAGAGAGPDRGDRAGDEREERPPPRVRPPPAEPPRRRGRPRPRRRWRARGAGRCRRRCSDRRRTRSPGAFSGTARARRATPL